MRFRVEPGDVPAHAAARRLGLTEAAFEEVKERLFGRGFPRPDETTGNYDLEAIDEWRARRHPKLLAKGIPRQAIDYSTPEGQVLFKARIEAMNKDIDARKQKPKRRINPSGRP